MSALSGWFLRGSAEAFAACMVEAGEGPRWVDGRSSVDGLKKATQGRREIPRTAA